MLVVLNRLQPSQIYAGYMACSNLFLSVGMYASLGFFVRTLAVVSLYNFLR